MKPDPLCLVPGCFLSGNLGYYVECYLSDEERLIIKEPIDLINNEEVIPFFKGKIKESDWEWIGKFFAFMNNVKIQLEPEIREKIVNIIIGIITRVPLLDNVKIIGNFYDSLMYRVIENSSKETQKKIFLKILSQIVRFLTPKEKDLLFNFKSRKGETFLTFAGRKNRKVYMLLYCAYMPVGVY